jgi:HlyD family secretion protein
VLSVRRESEGPVGAGHPVVVIGDPRALEIELDLLTADAALVRPGAPVTIDQWGGPGELRGRVRRIEPAAFTRLSALGVEEQRVNVIVDVDEPHERWASLGDGYRVEGRVLVWAADDVVRVPASAVFRNGEGWAAFRLEDGRADLVRVATGRHTDALVEVVGGLAAGDQVVAYPGEQVRDGARIAPR